MEELDTFASDARIPSYDDIHLLSRWAKVGFVGRCAERVLPLIHHDWRELTDLNLLFIRFAASTATVASQHAHETFANEEIERTAEFVRIAEEQRHLVAAAALAVCGIACAIPRVADTRRTSEMVIGALEQMVHAYSGIELNTGAVIGSVWPDYVLLRQAVCELKWNNYSCIPEDFFGALWPFGTPPGWPDLNDLDNRNSYCDLH